jgi:predicted ester cyclase
MSLEANKALARRIWEEVLNGRNPRLADELIAPDAVEHETAPGINPRGPEGLKAVVAMLSTGFPDYHFAVDQLIAEGDKVAAQTTFSGTHRGLFMGVPPTGKRVAQRQMHIVRLLAGKVVEHWAVRDDLGAFQQLGVIPEMPAAPASAAASA